MLKHILFISTALLLFFVIIGCDDTQEVLTSHNKYQDFIEHVEEHFVDGPFDTVMARGASTALLSDVSAEHTCFLVVSEDSIGWLSYTVVLESGETESDRTLFFDTPNIGAILFDANTEVIGHSADLDEVVTTVIECGVIFHKLTAKNYQIKLSNLMMGDTIRLVCAHGGDSHEDH